MDKETTESAKKPLPPDFYLWSDQEQCEFFSPMIKFDRWNDEMI